MNRHELTRTIQQQTRRLRLLLKKVAAGFVADDVHDFRVAAKKLRALLRLAGPADRRFPKGFRRIYKATGEIRNLQLLRHRLSLFRAEDRAPLPAGFFDELDRRLIAAKQETRGRIEAGGGFKKLSQRSIAGLPVRLTKVRQTNFVHTRIWRSRPDSNDIVEQLHALRKSLKDLLYAWPYIGNSVRTLAARRFGRYPAIKENARPLGDFLDGAIQLRLLEDRALFPGDLDLEMLHELRVRWSVRQDRLLRHLEKVLAIRVQPTVHAPVLPEKAAVNPLSAGNPSTASVQLHLD